MINRDQYIIMKNILKYLSTGAKTVTHIMHGCRMSNGQRKVYIDRMMTAGLITSYDEYGRPNYRTTGKGMEALELLERIYELCPFIMNAESGNNDIFTRRTGLLL